MNETNSEKPPGPDLGEYYTLDQAIWVLSKNAGRAVARNMPRDLVRYGKIISVPANYGENLYLKKEIDAYVPGKLRNPGKPKGSAK